MSIVNIIRTNTFNSWDVVTWRTDGLKQTNRLRMMETKKQYFTTYRCGVESRVCLLKFLRSFWKQRYGRRALVFRTEPNRPFPFIRGTRGLSVTKKRICVYLHMSVIEFSVVEMSHVCSFCDITPESYSTPDKIILTRRLNILETDFFGTVGRGPSDQTQQNSMKDHKHYIRTEFQ